jgi:hypothetical protein
MARWWYWPERRGRVVDDDAGVHRHRSLSSTMMGLMSISRSCGSAHTISDTRSSTCSSAAMSAAGAPRQAPRACATRERSISRRARNWFSGGSSIARSAISSIMVPPAPKVMTGPKGSSVVTPM